MNPIRYYAKLKTMQCDGCFSLQLFNLILVVDCFDLLPFTVSILCVFAAIIAVNDEPSTVYRPFST